MTHPFKNCVLLPQPRGHITQYFGENPALYKRFGLAYHNGIDLVQPHGTPLLAIEDGVVVSVAEERNGWGRHIRFISAEPDSQGNFREWVYAHNSAHHVKVGDVVKEGQHIADMGNSGFVVSGQTDFWRNNPHAGTHLHLGLRMVRKTNRGFSYAGSNIKLQVLNYENGVRGAIDPMPIIARIDAKAPRPQLLHLISLLERLKAKLNK
jgi:murein DD-endopeptidase MepM/ murein hydrolase activator NlpD